MNIKNRIRKIEAGNAQRFDKWLSGLSDEELEENINRYGRKDGVFSKWLETLTDDEIETLRYGKPGARALRAKFNEYQKPNQEDFRRDAEANRRNGK